MANKSTRKRRESSQSSVSESDEKYPTREFTSAVCASWAAKLAAEGMPNQLIDLVKKAEFEAWVMQQNHLLGEGLYYSEFKDLPPRFQKKIVTIAYDLLKRCSPNTGITESDIPSLLQNEEISKSPERNKDRSLKKTCSTSASENFENVNSREPFSSVRNSKDRQLVDSREPFSTAGSSKGRHLADSREPFSTVGSSKGRHLADSREPFSTGGSSKDRHISDSREPYSDAKDSSKDVRYPTDSRELFSKGKGISKDTRHDANVENQCLEPAFENDRSKHRKMFERTLSTHSNPFQENNRHPEKSGHFKCKGQSRSDNHCQGNNNESLVVAGQQPRRTENINNFNKSSHSQDHISSYNSGCYSKSTNNSYSTPNSQELVSEDDRSKHRKTFERTVSTRSNSFQGNDRHPEKSGPFKYKWKSPSDDHSQGFNKESPVVGEQQSMGTENISNFNKSSHSHDCTSSGDPGCYSESTNGSCSSSKLSSQINSHSKKEFSEECTSRPQNYSKPQTSPNRRNKNFDVSNKTGRPHWKSSSSASECDTKANQSSNSENLPVKPEAQVKQFSKVQTSHPQNYSNPQTLQNRNNKNFDVSSKSGRPHWKTSSSALECDSKSNLEYLPAKLKGQVNYNSEKQFSKEKTSCPQNYSNPQSSPNRRNENFDVSNKSGQPHCKTSSSASECDSKSLRSLNSEDFPAKPNNQGNYNRKKQFSKGQTSCPQNYSKPQTLPVESSPENLAKNCKVEPKKIEPDMTNLPTTKVSDPCINNLLKVIELRENKNSLPCLDTQPEHSANTLQRGQHCKRLEIQVSEKADDINYWESFLKQCLNHNDFTVNIASPVAQTLCVSFSDSEAARQAQILFRKNRKSKEPHILKVSNVKQLNEVKISKCINQSNGDVLDKIVDRTRNSLKELYERYKLPHDEKIKLVEEELDALDSHSDEHATVESKLDSLLAMKLVFIRYSSNVESKLNSVDKEINCMKYVEGIKKDFVRECNCLDGCLPIYSKKEEILQAVHDHQVSIVVAGTGSGKSTQLVQYLFREGYTSNGIIICTQPRKIAAISLSQYISKQMGSAVGDTVGYETGVRKKVSKSTKIVYMTDYTLLRKCLRPQEFDEVSCVVVDEAHERSLYTDLLLGMLKKLMTNRKDLKIIITSATIDPYTFLGYFNVSSEAVVKVPGQVYPVEVKWGDNAYVGWKYLEASVDCAYNIHCNSPDGAILVFLTCPSEVDEAIVLFREKEKAHRSKLSSQLLSLHGKQPAEDQLAIFEPSAKNCRKIIFATNSAETSLTIPEIKYVVDSGMAKESQYDKEKKRSALVVGFVSRSSATQRKGRAGRTQSGVCYRLYSEHNYHEDMIECSPPEILRCPLQQALLKIMELKIEPEKFDFINAPPKSCIKDAMYSLELLGAVRENHLTPLGKTIAKLPLEPQLGKLVIKGIENNIGYEAAIIAALASVSGQVFFRNDQNKDKADEEKLSFCHEFGDFYTFLIVFNEWVKLPAAEKVQWCQKHFVNPKAMKRTESTVKDLCLIIWNDLKTSIHQEFTKSIVLSEFYEPLLFDCFSENIFVYSGHDKAGYLSPNLEGSFYIHPSSSLSYLSVKMPEFVVCSTVLKTSRNFLINVTPVSEDIIVKAYKQEKFLFPIHLLKRLRVSPVVYKAVGEVLLVRYFLGKDGMNLKELEKKVRLLTKCSSFYINVSVQNGEIVAYIQPHHRDKVSKLIDEALEAGRQALEAEEIVVAADSDVHYTFALGSAGGIHDIILPGETREVIVKYRYGCNLNKSNCANVLKTLKSYGSLMSHKFIEDSHAVSVTFKKVSSVDKVVKSLSNDKFYQVMRGNIRSLNREDNGQSLFRIYVSWQRLTCTGTGSIELYDSASCIEASYKLSSASIYVGENYLVVEASKVPNTLTMRNLPMFAMEEDVRSALKKHLPDGLKIKNVTLKREQSVKITGMQIDRQRSKLLEIFGPYASPKNIEIDVRLPKDKDPKWSAVISFRRLEDCQKALSELKDKVKIGNFQASIHAMLKTQVFCNSQICRVLRKDIEACNAKYQALSSSSQIKSEQRNRGCIIMLSCEDIKHLVDMRREVIKLLEGRHIACRENPKLSKLFEQRSRVSFKEIEIATKTVIRINPVHKIISIYGGVEACAEAERFITNMSIGSNIIKMKVFDLHGDGLPTGFVKELYRRYGYGLRLFIKTFELKRASIDFEKHQLTLEGPYKKICEAENHLEDICFGLTEKVRDEPGSEDVEICPVCFDKIMYIEAIRLENCGHAVCKLCLQLQLKSQVFPVVCVSKDCGKPFFVEDFRKIFSSDPSMKLPFAMSALDNYIQRNPSEFRYCPIPDCSMIYRVTAELCQVLCYGCGNSICTHCHNLYHHGMSCEMFQNTKVDEDYPLKMWLSADAANRKLCPNCSMPIEKDGGCNHIICSQCQKHFCWMCLQMFASGDQVYDHIPYCVFNT